MNVPCGIFSFLHDTKPVVLSVYDLSTHPNSHFSHKHSNPVQWHCYHLCFSFIQKSYVFYIYVSDWLRAGWSGDRIPVVTRFSALVQTGPGAHPASCTMGTGSFPGVKNGRGVTLTPHPF